MHERTGTPAHRHFRLALRPLESDFYPEGLRQKDELRFASRAVNSIEINGTFYALQTPERFRGWAEDTPGLRFQRQGPRYITHVRRLREIDEPLANFFASGPSPCASASARSSGSSRRACASTASCSPISSPACRATRRRAEARPAQRRAPVPRGATSTAIRRSACGMPWKSAMRASSTRRSSSCCANTGWPWWWPIPPASGRCSATSAPTSSTCACMATSCTAAAARKRPWASGRHGSTPGPAAAGPTTCAGPARTHRRRRRRATCTATSTTTSRCAHLTTPAPPAAAGTRRQPAGARTVAR